jgi:pantothenate kinase
MICLIRLLLLNSFHQSQQLAATQFSPLAFSMSTSISVPDNNGRKKNLISSQFSVTWEPRIAEKVQELLGQKTDDHTFVLGVAGIPGSGKTTSSKILSEILDSRGIANIIMPMDGYHYPLSTLQRMDRDYPDGSNFVYRRGAPDTFDSSSLKQDLQLIKACRDQVNIPGFDHAKGDPEPNMYRFDPNLHRVVICEGLYLLHSKDGWKSIGEIFDLSVFINADVDACVDRLKIRNLCIPNYTKEEILLRCDEVDRVNAMTVLESSERADFVMDSMAS